jgi:hypothetical protein
MRIFSNVIVLVIFSINLIFDNFDPIKTNAETSASLKVLSTNWRSPYLSVVLTPDFATRLRQTFNHFIITKQVIAWIANYPHRRDEWRVWILMSNKVFNETLYCELLW